MKKIKCKELYRLPITSNLTKDIFELGFLYGKKRELLGFIKNGSLSLSVRMKFLHIYMEEFHENLKPISDNIRGKLNLMDLENIITIDYEAGEIVVLDITKKEHDKLVQRYTYMFTLDYQEVQPIS